MKGGDDNEYSNSSASDTPRNKRVNNAVNSAPSEAGSESLDNEVHIHCPKCDTTTWGDGMEDAFETANTHNKNQHNGKKVTEINREQHSGGGSVSSKSTVSDSDVSADSDSTDANKSSSDTHWRDDEYRDILSDSSTDSEPLAESTSNSSTSTKPSTDTGMKNSNKSVPPEVGSESSEDKVTGNSKYKYSTNSISGSPTSSGKPTGSTTNTSSNSKTTTESATSTPTSSRTSGNTSNNQEHYEYAQESEEYEYSTPSSKSATSAAPTDSALNNTNHPFDEESVAAEPTKDQQYFSQCQVCGESGSIWYVVAADYKTELLKCECCNHLWRKGAQCPVCSSWEADWEEGHPVECDDCGTLWEEVSNLIRKNRWKAKGGPQNGESKTKQQWQNVIED